MYIMIAMHMLATQSAIVKAFGSLPCKIQNNWMVNRYLFDDKIIIDESNVTKINKMKLGVSEAAIEFVKSDGDTETVNYSYRLKHVKDNLYLSIKMDGKNSTYILICIKESKLVIALPFEHNVFPDNFNPKFGKNTVVEFVNK